MGDTIPWVFGYRPGAICKDVIVTKLTDGGKLGERVEG
jgi:hypothetical protein